MNEWLEPKRPGQKQLQNGLETLQIGVLIDSKINVSIAIADKIYARFFLNFFQEDQLRKPIVKTKITIFIKARWREIHVNSLDKIFMFVKT